MILRALMLVLSGALGLALAGCGVLPPIPDASAPPASSAPATPPPAPVVPPTQVEIPSIKAASPLVATKLNADGTAEVPPTDQPAQASYLDWTDLMEPTRPLVIYGHVNGRVAGKSVAGVFTRLHELKAGSEVVVTRADQSKQVFVITTVEQIPKGSFPTDRVYNAVTRPAIRVITCTGLFNHERRSYVDNFIAYGELKT